MTESVPTNVQQIDGQTVTRLDRPTSPLITSVRGGLGTFQNQDTGAGDRLDYSGEELRGGQRFLNIRQTIAAQEFQIKAGSHAPQTFAPGDVTAGTDIINIDDHRLVDGQIVRVTSDTALPAGLDVTGTAATGVLTFTGNAADLETVTIDGKVYTFDDTDLDDINGHVLIGGSASDSIDNLIAAITLGAGAGTLYATSTTLHPTVTAAAGDGDTMDATAKEAGALANAIATIEGITGDWDDPTLLGGLDGDLFAIVVDADNFKLATTRAFALARTAIDITGAGTGVHTIESWHNVLFPPNLDLTDGTGAALYNDADGWVRFPAGETYTVQGDDGTSIVQFYWN